MTDRAPIYAEIDTERARQDAQWVPPEYAIPPSPTALLREVREVTQRQIIDASGGVVAEAADTMRRRFVVATAVAVAGIEAIDQEDESR